jgi:O-antigen/teichoic acid export membrane protein
MNEKFSRIGIFRTIVSVIASRIAVKFAVLISFLILGRALGAETFGKYAVFSASVYIAFQFANLGLRQASSHVIGQHPQREGAVMRALAIVFPVSVMTFIGVVWILTHNHSELSLEAGWLSLLLAGLGAVTISFMQGVNLGRGRLGVFNVTEIVLQSVSSLIILGLFLLSLIGALELDLSLAIWSLVAGFVTAGAFSLMRTLPGSPSRTEDPFVLGMLSSLLSYGWIYAFVLLLLTVNSRLAVFLIATSDPAAAGQYFVAQRLSEAFLEIASAVGLVLFSLGARAQDPVEILKYSAALTRSLVLMALLAGVVLLLVLPYVLRQTFTETEPIGLTTIVLLAATLPFTALNRTIYQALAGLGHPRIGAIGYGGAVLLNAGIAYALVPEFGISGAVGGFLAGQVLASFVLLNFIRMHYGLSAQMFLFVKRSDFTQLHGVFLQAYQRLRK